MEQLGQKAKKGKEQQRERQQKTSEDAEEKVKEHDDCLEGGDLEEAAQEDTLDNLKSRAVELGQVAAAR